MPRNGSGVASRVHDWTADQNAAILIRADRMDADSDDFAQMLTESIARDGQTPTTARIPFASGISADTITEKTAATGVTIDSVLLKDGQLLSSGVSAILGVPSGDTVYSFSRIQKTTGIAQSTTTDIFRFLHPDGSTVLGTNFIAGWLHINVVDEATGANASTYSVWIGTTGNGASDATLDTVTATGGSLPTNRVRGTALVTSFGLVADGVGGSVKAQITTAASGKTVTVRASFQGMIK
jgi:hypothetical protein